MEKSRKDPLRGVLIHPASQIGLEDEPILYSDQYTWDEEESYYGSVDNDETLTELRRVSKLLTQIAESLARLEGICMEIATRGNVQTASPVMWGQKQGKAHQLLVDLLEDNPEGVDVKRISAEAAMKGISMQTMRRVKQSMGLESEKHGTSWIWKWPDSK